MQSHSFDIPNRDRDAFLTRALHAAWVAGLALGIVAARFTGSALGEAIAAAAVSTVSFPALVVVTLFPLLFSACAVFLFPVPGIFSLCLLRSLSLGLMLRCACAVYGSGSWLLCSLLLFSAITFSPVLLWYWRRRVTLRRDSLLHDTLYCALAGILICAADVGLIAPFLADVITF